MEIYRQLRAILRFLIFVIFVLIYFMRSGFFTLITKDPIKRRQKQIEACSWTCRLVMKAFNIKLICHDPISSDEGSLLVGNHLGFLDIVCLQSLQPAVFITSLEMKNTPVLGQICDLGGCAYVNRVSRMKIQDELQDLVRVLKEGFRVVLYAESVASNGEQVLPFKKTLMMAAGLSQKPIRPFVFNFREINSGPVEYNLRDSVCWYGDQTFFPAIWRSLQLNSLVCEIEFLPLVHVNPEEDRTALAQRVHKMVSDKFVPFIPDHQLQRSTQFATGKITN